MRSPTPVSQTSTCAPSASYTNHHAFQGVRLLLHRIQPRHRPGTAGGRSNLQHPEISSAQCCLVIQNSMYMQCMGHAFELLDDYSESLAKATGSRLIGRSIHCAPPPKDYHHEDRRRSRTTNPIRSLQGNHLLSSGS